MKDNITGYRYNCFLLTNRRPTTLSQRLQEEQPDLRDPTENRVIQNGTRYFSRVPSLRLASS